LLLQEVYKVLSDDARIFSTIPLAGVVPGDEEYAIELPACHGQKLLAAVKETVKDAGLDPSMDAEQALRLLRPAGVSAHWAKTNTVSLWYGFELQTPKGFQFVKVRINSPVYHLAALCDSEAAS